MQNTIWHLWMQCHVAIIVLMISCGVATKAAAQQQGLKEAVAESFDQLWSNGRNFEFKFSGVLESTKERQRKNESPTAEENRTVESGSGIALGQFFQSMGRVSRQRLKPDVFEHPESRWEYISTADYFRCFNYSTEAGNSGPDKLYQEQAHESQFYPLIKLLQGTMAEGNLSHLVRTYTRSVEQPKDGDHVLNLRGPKWSAKIQVYRQNEQYFPRQITVTGKTYEKTYYLGEFVSVADQLYLTSWTEDYKVRSINSRDEEISLTLHSDITITDIKESTLSVEDLAFATHIKNGTPVNVQDSEWLHHEWRDGEVVQVTDPDAMRRLDQFEFTNQQSSSRWWWMILGGGLLTAVAVWFWKFRSVAVLIAALTLTPSVDAADKPTPDVPTPQPNAPSTPKDSAPKQAPDSQSLMGWDEPYCGIVSAWGVLNHFEKAPEFRSLITNRYIASWEGSTGQQLVDLLNEHGVPSEALIRSNPGTLSQLTGPAILHTRSRTTPLYRHWVLFLGFENDRLRIVDPAHGLQLLSAAELQSQWDGLMIVPDQSIQSSTSVLAGTLLEFVPFLILAAAAICVCLLIFRLPKTKSAKSAVSVAFSLMVLGIATGAVSNQVLPTGLNRSPAAVSTIAGLHPGEFLKDVEFLELMAVTSDSSAVLIDCRPPRSFSIGSIPTAINLPVDATTMEESLILKDIPQHTRIVLFCQSEHCTYDDLVARRLIGRGYRNVEQFSPGMNGWRAELKKSEVDESQDQSGAES